MRGPAPGGLPGGAQKDKLWCAMPCKTRRTRSHPWSRCQPVASDICDSEEGLDYGHESSLSNAAGKMKWSRGAQSMEVRRWSDGRGSYWQGGWRGGWEKELRGATGSWLRGVSLSEGRGWARWNRLRSSLEHSLCSALPGGCLRPEFGAAPARQQEVGSAGQGGVLQAEIRSERWEREAESAQGRPGRRDSAGRRWASWLRPCSSQREPRLEL